MSKKLLCVILEDMEDVVYVHKAWTKVAQGATRLAELPPFFHNFTEALKPIRHSGQTV